MSKLFNPDPPIRQELVDAALSGKLVVFIGAGISRLSGCPSWDGFATKVLEQLVPEPIDYHEKSLLDSIADPRKRLSIAKIIEEESSVKIDYEKIFEIKKPNSDIYKFINDYKCSFVTTNYDTLIKPEISKTKDIETWRFYNRADILPEKIDEQGNVVHLHGCIDNPKSMVITTNDYLEHYSSEEVQIFLEYLFKEKTVLFLGYGLEETEILEYIFKFNSKAENKDTRLFILQGFFNAENSLYEKLNKYYKNSFNADLIGFPKDWADFEHQKQIIESWGKNISFSPLAMSDDATAMLEELDG